MPFAPENVVLDPEEQEIEDHLEEYTPLPEAEEQAVIADFRRAARSGRTKVISLRFDETTLEKVKAEAEAEGLPYQTFIQSVMYKYITGRLVDQRDVSIVAKALSGTG
jgi:predicted DNA binding CopG/RHH family protein